MITSSVRSPEPMVSQPPQEVYTELQAVQHRPPNAQASAPTPQSGEAKSATETKPDEAKPQPASAAPDKPAAGNPMTIDVRFRIDQKTQDLTVFLLNRATREVIRTIPPGEQAKLTPGDLVNLFA
jgi:uncharacterized FlaG/YvyC family protein